MDRGETVARYRIVTPIAEGGMGEVYRAQMATIDGVEKMVALKVTRANVSKDLTSLFVDEARLAMRLSHGNIVQAFDVGRVDDRLFLAMEYIDGINLADLLWACSQRLGQLLPHRYVVFIAVELLKGLDYAHRRKDEDGVLLNVVHRDISPGNILISTEGEVKIADFGIAKSALRTKKTTQGRVKGKLPYIAPEQLRESGVDPRTDLFATGAVLYEMLTGTWRVDPANPQEAIGQVLGGEFATPRAMVPDIPDSLEAIVLRALQSDPADRFASAAAMRHELEQFAQTQGYLLSSADFADFLEELDAAQHRRPTGEASLPGLGRESSDPPSSEPPGEQGAPFNAMLGAELRKLDTGEPYSVYTTDEVLGAAATQPATSDFAAWKRSRKHLWIGAALAILLIALGLASIVDIP